MLTQCPCLLHCHCVYILVLVENTSVVDEVMNALKKIEEKKKQLHMPREKEIYGRVLTLMQNWQSSCKGISS